jgi:hypothetical protein
VRRAVLVVAALLTGCSTTSQPSGLQTPHSSSSPSSASVHNATARTTHSLQVRVSAVMRLSQGVSRAVVVPDGSRLLVLGGLAPGDSTTGRVVSVDLGARTAHGAGSLSTAVHDACGAVVGGHPVVFGGGAAATTATVQQWQPPRSRVVGQLPAPRSDSSCASLGGTAYVAGGFDGRGMTRQVLSTMDGRNFRVVAQLRQGVRYAAVAAVGQWLLVVGGALATTEGTANGAQSDLIQRVDLHTGRVAVIGHLTHALAHATGATVGGHVLVIGGRHGSVATTDILSVDPTTGAVLRVGRLPQALSDAAVANAGGTAFVVGGETSGPGAPVATVTAVRPVS